MRIRSIVTCVFASYAALLLLACGSPVKSDAPKSAAAEDSSSTSATISELADLNRQAREAFRKGRGDAAAALIEKAEPLSKRLMAATQPSLAATEAASDLDQLYGDMLLSNHNYGWARMLYQKNLARWKYWKPETAESDTRLKQARDSIAECDRQISLPPKPR